MRPVTIHNDDPPPLRFFDPSFHGMAVKIPSRSRVVIHSILPTDLRRLILGRKCIDDQNFMGHPHFLKNFP